MDKLSNKSCIKPQQKVSGKGYGIFYVDYSRDPYGEVRGPYHGIISSKRKALKLECYLSKSTLRRPVQVKKVTWTLS